MDVLERVTDNLELQGDDPEVEDLHCRPEQEVRLQRWKVNILELACHGSSSTTLCDRHEHEEGRQAYIPG